MSDTPDVDVAEPGIAVAGGSHMDTPKLDLEGKERIVAWMFDVRNGGASCRRVATAIMEEHAKARDAGVNGLGIKNPNPWGNKRERDRVN